MIQLPAPDAEVLAGRKLYGNDLDAAWFAAEEYGFFELYGEDYVYIEGPFPYQGWARADAAPLQGRRYDTCLALVWIDEQISRVTRQNDRYWRPAL